MSLATLFRAKNGAVAALHGALRPITDLVQRTKEIPVTLASAEWCGPTVTLRFSDGTTETVPFHVLNDHPSAVQAWWHAREEAAQRDFALWRLETTRTMLSSRRAAITVAEQELAELEESFSKRFG